MFTSGEESSRGLYLLGLFFERTYDYQQAAEQFEHIVNQFPTNAVSQNSLIHLASIYENELKDTIKAIHTYKRFYLLFPESEQAPRMLFLTGFIYNNDLCIFDSAKVAYEAFLLKYPNHKLALSAKFELNSLGKNPADILKAHARSVRESTKSELNKK
jgi:outer membrane protein assembly factor BamD (BamD/ComL family)